MNAVNPSDRFKQRYDGFMNVLSGLNAPGLDRSASTIFAGGMFDKGLARYWSTRQAFWDAAEIYISNGLAAKIIDRPADDCVAQGITIENDPDGIMEDEYDRLAVYQHLSDGLRWARLYGGSAIMMIARDGEELYEPLNLEALDIVEELRQLDISQLRPTDAYYTDPRLLTYGKPEVYEVTPPSGEKYLLHETRIIPIGTTPLPITMKIRNGLYWVGKSVLEGCMDSIGRYHQGLDWALRILERKQQGIYQMKDLGEMFAQGDDPLVTQRIQMVDMVRSVLNSVVIDSEDTYDIKNLDLSGIQQVVQEFMVSLSAEVDIPVVILFGKSSTGLNATGMGDLENYFSMVGRIQERNAKPALERLTAVLWQQRIFRNKTPDDWKVVFNPLWEPTAKEQAETKKNDETAKQAVVATVQAAINASLLLPEEGREIILNECYPDYDFDNDLSITPGSDIDYARDVDTGGSIEEGDVQNVGT